MNSMLVVLAAATLNLTNWVGHYVGHTQANRDKMLSAAKPAEYRKLLAYALDRLGKAREELTLRKDGTFLKEFDDGFPPDKSTLNGRWKVTTKGLELDVRGQHRFTLVLDATNDGRLVLRGQGAVPKGLWTTFEKR